MNSRYSNKKNNESGIPNWLKYLIIILAILALIGIMFKWSGPLRDDFPVY